MKYILMHKRKAVAGIELDESTGYILKILELFDSKHLPIGISCKNGIVDRTALNEWWAGRSIPASRSGVRNALEYLNMSDTKTLLVRSFGLSLSDHYWIKPKNKDITWDSINFFDNAFSEDIGDVLFGNPKKSKKFDYSSPDNTSDGFLKKRWQIVNGKRCLVKGGNDLVRQQPFNEVIVSKIMDLLGIYHVSYDLIWYDGSPYSICEDFLTGDTELVSARRILQIEKKPNSVSAYRHFVNCCQELGVKDIVKSLDRMLVLDYIIANEDRHLNNFGLVRNANTLDWLGFAPIYDSGNSLGYDKVTSQIKAYSNIICKPFKKSHADQIKLVSDFSWIDFERLSGVEEIIREVMSVDQARELINESRISAIVSGVKTRIDALKDIASTHTTTADTIEGDVERNIEAKY